MKLEVHLKDPDGFCDAIDDALDNTIPDGLDEGERETLVMERHDKIQEGLKRWVKYGECVTIVFDLDHGTATVKEL